jgi:hypothetical protein
MRSVRGFVFGYGSLTAGASSGAEAGFPARLHGVRRRWRVAMDNRVDLPGYKCYRDAAGHRPPVSVCFLDLEADLAARTPVNGLCLPVDAADLAALDRRERNYERIEVSDRVDGAGGARVWTYRGSPAGRARFDAAARAGTAVIHAAYLRAVRSGFRALGEGEWEACAPSLAPGALPVVELVRHELPERQ